MALGEQATTHARWGQYLQLAGEAGGLQHL